MKISEAIETLGFTSPKSASMMVKMAESRLSTMTKKAPLRHKVACKVIIEHFA